MGTQATTLDASQMAALYQDSSTQTDHRSFKRSPGTRDIGTDVQFPPCSYNFTGCKKKYIFSTEFDIDSNLPEKCAKIIRSIFHLRPHYDIYSQRGYEGRAIGRFFSLGLFYPWAKEFDIYDNQGRYIGMIDGQVVTTASARFSIYDGNGSLQGVAFIDREAAGATIVDPQTQTRNLVTFRRNYVQDTTDDWTVKIQDSQAIDSRILQTFTAFLIDYQEAFKKDR